MSGRTRGASIRPEAQLASIAKPSASRASAWPGVRPDPLTSSPTAGALLLRDNLTRKPKNFNRTLGKERKT